MNDQTSSPPPDPALGRRHQARRSLLQALYAWELGGRRVTSSTLVEEFLRRTKVGDEAYFRDVLSGALSTVDETRASCAPCLDRPWDLVDPVERSILMLATYELRARSDVPQPVVLDEAIELAREFGAPDSHRFVNAVLDRLRRSLPALPTTG